MSREVKRIITAYPADRWFEINGTKDSPILSRVAYWAHVKVGYRDVDGKLIEGEGELVIGVTGIDVPLEVSDYSEDSPVGYIHADDLQEGKIPYEISRNYIWGDK